MVVSIVNTFVNCNIIINEASFWPYSVQHRISRPSGDSESNRKIFIEDFKAVGVLKHVHLIQNWGSAAPD
ncbi:MAG: hypothetical protein COB10_04400, partial [Planctomycetota bacterium]